MATKKIDKGAKEEIVIAHACGIDFEKIQERYGISQSLIWQCLKGVYSTADTTSKREVRDIDLENNPITNFYRESGRTNKDKNLMLYYAINPQNIQEGQSILGGNFLKTTNPTGPQLSRERLAQEMKLKNPDNLYFRAESPLCDLEMYLTIKEFYNKSGLESFDKNKTNKEKFIETILFPGYKPLERIILNQFDLNIENAINNQNYNFKDIKEETLNQILSHIKSGGINWINEEGKLEMMLLNWGLRSRDLEILDRHFGLSEDKQKGQTLQQIGNELNLDSGRVRQIKEKGLRKLRETNLFREVNYNYQTPSVKEDIDKIREEHEEFLESYRRDKKYDLRPIDELNLTERTHNALIESGIKTIGQLSRMKGQELMRFKNFGRKSLNETWAKMEDGEIAHSIKKRDETLSK